MDLICPLPNAPHTLIECENQRLVLAFADGLAELKGAELDFVARDEISAAARGPDGHIYCTSGDSILRYDLSQASAPQDITPAFAGTPQGDKRIVCTPEGDLWVEGCSTRRCLDGSFHANPADPTASAPAWTRPPGARTRAGRSACASLSLCIGRGEGLAAASIGKPILYIASITRR